LATNTGTHKSVLSRSIACRAAAWALGFFTPFAVVACGSTTHNTGSSESPIDLHEFLICKSVAVIDHKYPLINPFLIRSIAPCRRLGPYIFLRRPPW
jgi:hypothetical protein